MTMPTLPRLLFPLTVALAAGLVVLVFVAPLFDPGEPTGDGVRRAVALFARDVPLRRTALASALGLVVTACVFFRAPEPKRPSRSPKLPPPPDIAGA
jgi:hypothetical protein